MESKGIRTFRRAGHDDRKAVLDLWNTVGLSAANEVEWQALTHGATVKLMVTYEAEQLAGTVVVAYDGWRAYVYHVAVAPFARGRGLGRALMAEAEGELLSQGARRVYVEVGEANIAGLALCSAVGYAPEGDIAMVKEF